MTLPLPLPFDAEQRRLLAETEAFKNDSLRQPAGGGGSGVDQTARDKADAAKAAADANTAALAGKASTTAVQAAQAKADAALTPAAAASAFAPIGAVVAPNFGTTLVSDSPAVTVRQLPQGVIAPNTVSIPELLRQITARACRYQVATWLPTTYGSGTGRFTVTAGEANIRQPAVVAGMIATYIASGAWDSTELLDNAGQGITEAAATAWVVRIVDSLVAQHRTSNPTGNNGDRWSADIMVPQAVLWASHLALAAAALPGAFTSDQLAAVRAMVAYEADWVVANRANGEVWRSFASGIKPPRRPNTTDIAGNTHTEESSWNCAILSAACAAMPTHPNAGAWMLALVKNGVTTHAWHDDKGSIETVNGVQVGSYLLGYNIDTSGILANHDVVQVDYVTAGVTSQSLGMLLFALAGRPSPRALRRGWERIYSALVDLPFPPADGFVDPPSAGIAGGAIAVPETLRSPSTAYTRDSNGNPLKYIYYPEADPTRPKAWYVESKACTDVLVHMFSADLGCSVPAATWARLHLQQIADWQARFTGANFGRIHGTTEVFDYQPDQYAAGPLSFAWGLHAMQRRGQVRVTDAAYTTLVTPATGDVTAPTISALNLTGGDNKVTGAFVDSDNTAVTRRLVQRVTGNGTTRTTIYDGSAANWIDATAVNGTAYTYIGRSFDAAGNASPEVTAGPITPAAPPTIGDGVNPVFVNGATASTSDSTAVTTLAVPAVANVIGGGSNPDLLLCWVNGGASADSISGMTGWTFVNRVGSTSFYYRDATGTTADTPSPTWPTAGTASVQVRAYRNAKFQSSASAQTTTASTSFTSPSVTTVGTTDIVVTLTYSNYAGGSTVTFGSGVANILTINSTGANPQRFISAGGQVITSSGQAVAPSVTYGAARTGAVWNVVITKKA